MRLERSALFDLHLGVSPPPLPPRVLSASPYVSLNLNDATPHFPRTKSAHTHKRHKNRHTCHTDV